MSYFKTANFSSDQLKSALSVGLRSGREGRVSAKHAGFMAVIYLQITATTARPRTTNGPLSPLAGSRGPALSGTFEIDVRT